MSLSINANACIKLWGPCPCGHDPRPCTCVQGPKKTTHRQSTATAQPVAVFCTLNHQTNVVAHNGGVNDLVQARVRQAATVGSRLTPPQQQLKICRATQQGHRPPQKTGSRRPAMNGNCGTSKTCRAQQRECERRDKEPQLQSHSFLHVWTKSWKLHDLHNTDVDHYVQQQGNLLVTRTMGTCLCVKTGMTTTMRNCNCRIFAVLCTAP